jgi:hypothetical protein
MVSVYSLFQDIHNAYAQSLNSTSIFVPSNMNRMEITLKNDQSANPSSIFENPLTIALISGLTAILGGIMGSYMTNRSNRQMEDKRYERERKREKEIQEQQKNQNEEYRQKIISKTLTELEEIAFWLKHMQEKNRPKDYPDTIKSILQAIKLEYPLVPYDTRLSLFSPNILFMVESIYSKIQAYKEMLFIFIDEYKMDQTEPFEVAVNKLTPGADGLKSLVDIVITQLKKELPKETEVN